MAAMRGRSVCMVAALGAGLIASAAAMGDTPIVEESAILTSLEGQPGLQFGGAVASDGNLAVVGEVVSLYSSPYSGAAYIFARVPGSPDGWAQVKRLTKPDSVGEFERFGYSVAIRGDLIVVTDYGDMISSGNYTQGSAYIFGRDVGGPDNWGFVKKLVASDGRDNNYFGLSVAMTEDVIVVGAPDTIVCEIADGAAYVYERDAGGPGMWGEVAILAPCGLELDWFGGSVSVSGDTIAVGQSGEEGHSSVRIYQRDAGGPSVWGQVKRLTLAGGTFSDHFGTAVSLSGDTLIVGSPSYAVYGGEDRPGAAYIYERNEGGSDQWGQVASLASPDGLPGDFFGGGVEVDGDVVIVRASVVDGSDVGGAFVFERDAGGADAWGEVARIMPDGRPGTPHLDGRLALAGVPGWSESRGAAYVYRLGCLGDLDGDWNCTMYDFSVFVSSFGVTGLTPFEGCDLDGDGAVTVFDFGIFASAYGCTW